MATKAKRDKLAGLDGSKRMNILKTHKSGRKSISTHNGQVVKLGQQKPISYTLGNLAKQRKASPLIKTYKKPVKRAVRPKGHEKFGSHALTDKQCEDLEYLLSVGVSYRAAAKEFKVSPRTITLMVRRFGWDTSALAQRLAADKVRKASKLSVELLLRDKRHSEKLEFMKKENDKEMEVSDPETLDLASKIVAHKKKVLSMLDNALEAVVEPIQINTIKDLDVADQIARRLIWQGLQRLPQLLLMIKLSTFNPN